MGPRIDRIEAAIVHLTDVVVLQSGRLDGIHGETRSLREETRSLREETRSLREETHSVRHEMRTMREALTERLDRLIAVTIEERTIGIERLASIEARLARLEGHVGL